MLTSVNKSDYAIQGAGFVLKDQISGSENSEKVDHYSAQTEWNLLLYQVEEGANGGQIGQSEDEVESSIDDFTVLYEEYLDLYNTNNGKTLHKQAYSNIRKFSDDYDVMLKTLVMMIALKDSAGLEKTLNHLLQNPESETISAENESETQLTDNLYDLVYDVLMTNNYAAESIFVLEKTLEKQPSERLFELLSNIYLVKGQYDKCNQLSEQAKKYAKTQKSTMFAFRNAAVSYLAQGKNVEAKLNIEKALELDHENYYTITIWIMVHAACTEYDVVDKFIDENLANFEADFSNDPENEDLRACLVIMYNMKANFYAINKDMPTAKEFCLKTLVLDDENAIVVNMLGDILLNFEADYFQAINYYERVIEIEHGKDFKAESLSEISFSFSVKKDESEKADQDALLSNAIENIIYSYNSIEDTSSLTEQLERIYDMIPLHRGLNSILFHQYLVTENYDKALLIAQNARNIFPEETNWVLCLLRVKMLLGQTFSAIDEAFMYYSAHPELLADFTNDETYFEQNLNVTPEIHIVIGAVFNQMDNYQAGDRNIFYGLRKLNDPAKHAQYLCQILYYQENSQKLLVELKKYCKLISSSAYSQFCEVAKIYPVESEEFNIAAKDLFALVCSEISINDSMACYTMASILYTLPENQLVRTSKFILLQKTVQANSNFQDAHSKLANYYLEEGKESESIKHYIACLESADTNIVGEPHVNDNFLANTFNMFLEYYKKSLSLDMAHMNTYFTIITILWEAGYSAKTMDMLNICLGKIPYTGDDAVNLEIAKIGYAHIAQLPISLQNDPDARILLQDIKFKLDNPGL